MNHSLAIFFASVVIAGSVNSATAAEWHEASDKGLLVYTLGNGATGQLTMVCDPENIWAAEDQKQSPQYYVFVSRHNQRLDSDTLSIKASDFDASMASPGGAFVASSDKKTWNKLIATISEPGKISIGAGKDKFALDVTKPMKTRCQLETE
ncbi:hypothetical protein FG152_24715 [Ochrobactrum sp. XJ1]|nr:hypothetical protein [Ochrobactrum sp. XJ1]